MLESQVASEDQSRKCFSYFGVNECVWLLCAYSMSQLTNILFYDFVFFLFLTSLLFFTIKKESPRGNCAGGRQRYTFHISFHAFLLSFSIMYKEALIFYSLFFLSFPPGLTSSHSENELNSICECCLLACMHARPSEGASWRRIVLLRTCVGEAGRLKRAKLDSFSTRLCCSTCCCS